MDEAPSLRLEFLQGPRQGETLEFRPGTAVRIGRLIRGNTLPIKDSGVSSKHLSILIESDKWVLQDLDSSNGTVLDGSKIPPFTSFPLRDGSVIKIGELTSIVVKFLPRQNAAHIERKKPSRRGRPEPVDPDPDGEGSVAVVEPAPKPQRGGRKGMKGKVQFQGIDEDESGLLDRPASSRVTRNLKNMAVSDSAVENSDVPEEKVGEQKNIPSRTVIVVSDSGIANSDAPQQVVAKPKNTRVARNLKKKGVSDSVTENLDAVEQKAEEQKNIPNPSAIEVSESSIANSDAPQQVVAKSKNKRVSRNSKNKGVSDSITGILAAPEEEVEPKNTLNPSVIEVSDLSIANSDAPQKLVGKPKNTRVTRSSKNKQSEIGNINQNPSLECVVENVEKRNTRRGKKKLQEEGIDDGGKDENEDIRSVKENCDGNEKENLNEDGDVNVNVDWPDLEKMSLGEWFDFLEVHLPKQIIDETEGLIDSMREKAQRLQEYIIMQQSNKVQMPVE